MVAFRKPGGLAHGNLDGAHGIKDGSSEVAADEGKPYLFGNSVMEKIAIEAPCQLVLMKFLLALEAARSATDSPSNRCRRCYSCPVVERQGLGSLARRKLHRGLCLCLANCFWGSWIPRAKRLRHASPHQ